MDALSRARGLLEANSYTPREWNEVGVKLGQDGARRSLYQVLALPEVEVSAFYELQPNVATIEPAIAEQLKRDATYANYIERQKQDVLAVKRDEALAFPSDFDYAAVDGLSNELRMKLGKARPANIAQAAKIEGVTPAALTLLLARLRRDQRRMSA
jgi:tRNA uridine 5-carboxymethylaminomethyl modification enzyme